MEEKRERIKENIKFKENATISFTNARFYIWLII